MYAIHRHTLLFSFKNKEKILIAVDLYGKPPRHENLSLKKSYVMVQVAYKSFETNIRS